MGATTGIVGATVITLGLLTLPALIRRGYNKSIACGSICASGTLGQIIPPSLVLILLSDITQQSVGTLFAAAVGPGLLLAAIYLLFILGLALLNPRLMPALSQAELDSVSGRELFKRFWKVVFPPIILVLAVLGSIIGGIAAPTEAACMGALGSIAITALSGRLNWSILLAVAREATKITAMILFILMMAQVFALAFRGLEGEQLIERMFDLLPGGVNSDIWFMLFLIFILGFFIEWIEISYIAVPLFLPILVAQGVDPVWLAMLITINLQSSFLTPPFGWALFYLKGVAPPGVTIGDIYKGVIPFVLMQLLAFVIVFLYPQLALWLPKAIGW